MTLAALVPAMRCLTSIESAASAESERPASLSYGGGLPIGCTRQAWRRQRRAPVALGADQQARHRCA
eukprot:4648236-Pyramimonas_sp.AAC.1